MYSGKIHIQTSYIDDELKTKLRLLTEKKTK